MVGDGDLAALTAFPVPDEPVETKWHIITGGPCSGKTSVLNYLSALGYQTRPEAARLFDDVAKSHGIEDPKQETAFSGHVQRYDLLIEDLFPHDTEAFADRSFADNIAYAQHIPDQAVTEEMWEIASRRRYSSVHHLDLLPVYETDDTRDESRADAEEIDDLLWETYEQLGYGEDHYRVPVMPIDERVQYILDRV